MAYRWRVLTLVSVAVFLAGLDMFIVNVAFPEIARAFDDADEAAVSWVLNAYVIVVAALMVPAGRLADRSGRRRVFLWGLVLFAAGSGLCGAATSIETLVAARVIQAIGAAFLLPTSLALLMPEFSAAERPMAIGVWAGVGGLAAAFGPPVGGLLVELSWRWVFLVNLPVIAVALLIGTRMLRETRETSPARSDLLGALILALAVGLLALGLVQAPDWGWGDARTTGSLALAVLGIAGFWLRCQTHPAPVLEPALLRVRAAAAANLASLLFSASFAAMLLAAVLYLTEVWGNSVLAVGVSLAPGPLVAACSAPVAGRLAGRVGQRPLAVIGTTTFAVGCGWWLLNLGDAPAYAAEMLPGLLVTGLGVGLVLPSLASAATTSLPPDRLATGSAVYTMSRQLGFALGVAILVALLGDAGSPSEASRFESGWAFMVIAAALAAAASSAIGAQADPSTAQIEAPDGAAASVERGRA